MTSFTKQDVKNLLDDLKLYSGCIARITNVRAPHINGDEFISGVIHTWMDKFNFTAMPFLCDENTWRIELSDPVESLRKGHRRTTMFTFPKIHQDSAIVKRYEVANVIYEAYEGHSHVIESSRLSEHERVLGYEKLPSYQAVLSAIINDFRSHQENKHLNEKAIIQKN